MGLIKTLFTNCAHPKGRMGRAMLKFMNLFHAPLTNWGLSLVDIQEGWTMQGSHRRESIGRNHLMLRFLV
jgi:hypothetical protein